MSGVVLTLGETMGVAVTGRGERLRTANHLRFSTAGAESTVAIGLSRLGVPAAWLGVVGADEVGARILRDLAGEGVDLRWVRTESSARTGFMLRELRTVRDTVVTYYRSGSAGSQLAPADVDRVFAGDGAPSLLHLTGITPALSETCRATVYRAVEVAVERGVPVSFDVNHRTTLPGSAQAAGVAADLLPSVDLLFVGEDELHVLGEEGDPEAAAARLADRGPRCVVVKRGAQGALAVTVDGERAAVAGAPVPVLDVIGAGDSFVAGYLAAWTRGESLADCLLWGATAAECTVTSHGDWEGLPTAAELAGRIRLGDDRTAARTVR